MEKINKDNYKKEIFNNITNKHPFSFSKNELIISHKNSLEKILSSVKKCQLDYLSNKESLKEKENITNAKQILLLFKEKLHYMLNKKNKLHEQLKSENENKKKNIQKILFIDEEKKSEENYKNKKVNASEINQLKMLNFEIENKIRSNDFLIAQKNKIIRADPLYFKEKNEIYLNSDNNNKVSDILNNDIDSIKKKLMASTKLKEEKENKIKLISNQIDDLKDIFEENKIVKCNDIENNYKEELKYDIVTTTISAANNNINNNIIKNISETNNDKTEYKKGNEDTENDENLQQSFHSSLYTDILSIDDDKINNENELGVIIKHDKININQLNLSNDNINTDNTNYISNKGILNNEFNNIFNINYIERRIQTDNFIFLNLSDN
jgi:hypothetical protein